MEEIKDFDPKDVEENKIFAALSYIWILFIIPLITKRESKFAVEHAKQGLVLFIIELIITVLWWIPILGYILGYILSAIVAVVSIIAFIYALQGRFWKIPFVYEFAKSFKF